MKYLILVLALSSLNTLTAEAKSKIVTINGEKMLIASPSFVAPANKIKCGGKGKDGCIGQCTMLSNGTVQADLCCRDNGGCVWD